MKTTQTLILFCFICYGISVFAQIDTIDLPTRNITYVAAVKDTLNFPSLGGKYVGELNKNGAPDGYGILISNFGGGYEGNWKNGVYNGFGINTWHNGDVYVGSWKNGLRHKQGTMTWASSMEYNGQWKNDTQNGKGKITYPAGNGREGVWKFGKMHGGGFHVSKDGKRTPDEYWYGFNRKENKIKQPEKVSFTTIIDKNNATKDGIYIKSEDGIFEKYVVDIDWNEIQKLDGKKVKITGKLSYVKGIGNSKGVQGRSQGMYHIYYSKIKVLKN